MVPLPDQPARRAILDRWLQGRCVPGVDLDQVAAQWCPPERCRYHAALYDALAGALLLARLVTEPAIKGRPLAWLLANSTFDPEKRDAINQGNLF